MPSWVKAAAEVLGLKRPKHDIAEIVCSYKQTLERTESRSQSSVGVAYLSEAKDAFNLEEKRLAYLRSSASGVITLNLLLLTSFVAFGDEFGPITDAIGQGGLRASVLTGAVVSSAVLLLRGSWYALKILDTYSRNLVGPREFLPIEFDIARTKSEMAGLPLLSYEDWVAGMYVRSTIENYVVDGKLIDHMTAARSATRAAVLLLLVTTFLATVTKPDPAKEPALFCTVERGSAGQLCLDG